MTQSLDRAFDLLEAVAKHGAPAPLSALAKACELHPATAARLLQSLVARGYLEQPIAKGPYSIGPAPFALCQLAPYRPDLRHAVSDVVDQLARDLRVTVTASVLRGGRRFHLAKCSGDQEVTVSDALIESPFIYRAPTGRLLLAQLSVPELASFMHTHGYPSQLWPDIRSADDLAAQLAPLRERDEIIDQRPEVVSLARPLRQAGRVVAALGAFLPTERYTDSHAVRVRHGMAEAASTIETRLEHP
ncbi:MAG: helix-turn-helix domain-containing protein [Planctomycetota bacterium]|jgi:IclR family acetate operon transcriptional repressor|nr:helix-turn-helix domain-containing protein [Planctomycetota bacterium]